jgi:uncharacterized protein YjiS (DUF1127 family)
VIVRTSRRDRIGNLVKTGPNAFSECTNMPNGISFANRFMVNSATQVPFPLRAHLGRVARGLAQLFRAAKRRPIARRPQREAARELSLRDDRLLADIGLRRDEIECPLHGDAARRMYLPP